MEISVQLEQKKTCTNAGLFNKSAIVFSAGTLLIYLLMLRKPFINILPVGY